MVSNPFLRNICIYAKKAVTLRGFMKKILIGILLFLFACVKIWAGDSLYNQEHENILTVRYGGLWQQDQYLSPLLYSGQHIGLSNEWWQGFLCDSTKHWQHVGRAQIIGGMAYSEPKNNLIYSVGLQ